jgi:hypothetical protein
MNSKEKLLHLEQIVNETPNDTILAMKIRTLIAKWAKTNQPKVEAYPTFELLNSEGPILVIKRTPEHFLLFDEWKFMIGKMSAKTLMSFLHGNSTVTDTHDRVWNYAEQHSGMKGDHVKLMEFIKPLIKE